MTDQERLVRAKDLIEGMITGVDAEWGMQDDQIELVRWVVDQVEDVQELEKNILYYKQACASWEAIESYGRKEAQRYKQALEEILAEGEFEDVHAQLERITTIASEALKGEPSCE